LRHIGEANYSEISATEFEEILQETYKNIDTLYLDALKKNYIKQIEPLLTDNL
jgi:hypothetical protein